MNVDELTAVLAGPEPDRAAVLASFYRKHRRRKVRQRLCWTGAVAVSATATVALITLGPWRSDRPVAFSPPGCTQASLARSLVRARQAGASILIAFESPTGQTAGSGYTAVVLDSVQTLSGPAVSSGAIAWTDGTAVGGADDGGRVLAIVWPAALAGSPVGAVVRATPVVGDNVMFPASGCTHVADLPAPGSVTSGVAPTGGIGATTLYAVPLRTVEEAAVSPAGGSQPGNSQPGEQPGPSRAAPAKGGNQSPGSGATSAASDQQGDASPSGAAHSSSNPGAGKGSSESGGKSQGNGSGSSGGSDQQ